MKRVAMFAVAVAATLAGTAATPAPAGPVYVAVPATPSTRTTFITRSTVWHAQDRGFVTGQAPERAAVLCELVVRQVGGLASFSVAGKPYDADQLAKCNAKAKKD